MSAVLEQVKRARQAGRKLAVASTGLKNRALETMAQVLADRSGPILEANAGDVRRAAQAGMPGPMQQRLGLSEAKLRAAAAGLRQLIELPDPIGEVMARWQRPNGLVIEQVRVPMGVIGIIYESRPNVTVDAASLCLKAGSAAVLRGGREDLASNQAIVAALQEALATVELPVDAVQLVADPSREAARELMTLHGELDLLIPRGGAGLIQTVVREASVPVIETGVGNCHVYVDRAADLAMAVQVTVNAKVSNPAVCNAAETLLVHRDVAPSFLPRVAAELGAAGVVLRGCPRTRELVPQAEVAEEADWETEYLDLIMAVRVVESLEEAIQHINRYGTMHSEAIITGDAQAAGKFLAEVDAAAVYHNASTRFTDGFEFGFGAEIGISTQKLHARGPMGLKEICSYNYRVLGDGQVRV